MRVRVPLWGKVLLVALLNAALLGTASVWFLRELLAQEFGSILLGSARDRIVTVGRAISLELSSVTPAERDNVLARYSERYDLTFYLFENSGAQRAGPRRQLPPPVEQALRSGIQSRVPFSPPSTLPPEALLSRARPPMLVEAEPGFWFVLRIPVRAWGVDAGYPGTLLLSTDTLTGNELLFDRRPWLKMLALVLAIVLVCWVPFVGDITRTIQRMVRATGNLAEGRWGARVQVKRADELGQLSESINRMAVQLEDHVHGQKRFLRDAAHELRSPLARMQAVLGLLERQTGPESERLLNDLREEIQLMSSLTGDLLTFARSDTSAGPPRLCPVNVAETAARAVATENPGSLFDVQVQIEPDVYVTANEEGLYRCLSNLVRNAIRYAGEDGPILVTAAKRDDSAVISVADRGPGIPEEALERVFTAFYRLDSSRDRKTGGTGLGMAIARSCIENSRGTVRCRNRKPGLEVVITLPLAQQPAAALKSDGGGIMKRSATW